MASTPWAGSGTATTVAAAVIVTRPIDGLVAGSWAIKNTGGTNSLLVAFDAAGSTFVTVAPGESLGFSDVIISAVEVKSNTSTTTYEWIAAE